MSISKAMLDDTYRISKCYLKDANKMFNYLKRNWIITISIWCVSLFVPIFHIARRDSNVVDWTTIGEVYISYFTVIWPSVFTNAFIKTFPFSLLFLCLMSFSLMLHILFCSFLSQSLARLKFMKKLFGKNRI